MIYHTPKPRSKTTIRRHNMVYERFQKSVLAAGYNASRACDELEWLLEDYRWLSISNNGNEFVRRIDLSKFRIDVDRRKKLVKKLAEIHGSQREIGKALGISDATVARDLGMSRGATNVARVSPGKTVTNVARVPPGKAVTPARRNK